MIKIIVIYQRLHFLFLYIYRIRQEKNGGAWCPKAQISSAIREYLEIDLTRDHLIAWTETQGRFGNGQGQEYAEAFFLEYWRDTKWHQYKNLKGDRVRICNKSIKDHLRCFVVKHICTYLYTFRDIKKCMKENS